jgi:hypothetical protein
MAPKLVPNFLEVSVVAVFFWWVLVLVLGRGIPKHSNNKKYTRIQKMMATYLYGSSTLLRGGSA